MADGDGAAGMENAIEPSTPTGEGVFFPVKVLSRSPTERVNALRQTGANFPLRNANNVLMTLRASPVEEKRPKRRGERLIQESRTRKSRKTNSSDMLSAFFDDLKSLALMIQATNVRKDIKSRMDMLVNDFIAYKDAAMEAVNDKNSNSDDGTAFRNKMKEAMDNKTDLNELLNADWPISAYLNTNVGRSEDTDGAAISTVLVQLEKFADDKNFKYFTRKIPELSGISKDMLAGMGSITVSQKQSVKISGMGDSSAATHLLLKGVTLNDMGIPPDDEVLRWVDELKAKAKETGILAIHACIPKETDLSRVRKLLEIATMETDLQILLRPNILESGQHQPQPTAQQEGLLITAKEGTSFADIVRKIKTDVNPRDIGIEHGSFMETQSGAVKVMVRERIAGGKAELTKRIEESLGQLATVREVVNKKPLAIIGLDPDTEEHEVATAFANEYGTEVDLIRVNQITSNRYNKRVVTVLLPSEIATQALRRGSIGIGWAMCRILEKVNPPKCPRCQEFGHSRRDCKAVEEVAPKCYRCGVPGHQAGVCKGQVKCYVCKEEGHSANSMACASYRNLVHAMKAKTRDGFRT